MEISPDNKSKKQMFGQKRSVYTYFKNSELRINKLKVGSIPTRN